MALCKCALNNLVVKDVQISVYGDLRVYLANNIIIEVIGDSMAKECWRFFDRDIDQHIVMIGCDIEVDEKSRRIINYESTCFGS